MVRQLIPKVLDTLGLQRREKVFLEKEVGEKNFFDFFSEVFADTQTEKED